MAPRPILVAQPPLSLPPFALSGAPVWIGSGSGAGLRVLHPSVADRHAGIVERADGFWIYTAQGATPPPTVNGAPLDGEQLLRDGDRIALAPGVVFEFDTGEVRPEPPPPPRLRRVRKRVRKRRPRSRRPRRVDGRSLGAKIGIAAAILLVLAGVTFVVVALTRDPAPRPLTQEQGIIFDSLMSVAYDHIETGTALLNLGASSEALEEFARAVTTLETSSLRDDPWVLGRVAELEGAIAGLYRYRQREVPDAYRDAKSGPTTLSRDVAFQMSVKDFAERVEELQVRFETRFGRRIVVTGEDHPEHVSLYGKGGALDLRVKDLTSEQVDFAVQQARSLGIRVKDFSDNRVLQRQVASAQRAGLDDRAGTGLHLHIDRMVSRRDAYTVR